nr:retrovirus-related Pol polyprotein from transposon TNT 1-94 [Tanacetum cinerariifolium]
MGLWCSKDTDMSLTAYADADHAGCQDIRRSSPGSAQFLGDKFVSWSSKKQKRTAISSTEIPLYCDNKSVIALCYNNIQHSRANHIDVRYHFIKEQVENGIVELYFVQTEYQLADIFTRSLPRERFNFLIDKLESRLPLLLSKTSLILSLFPKRINLTLENAMKESIVNGNQKKKHFKKVKPTRFYLGYATCTVPPKVTKRFKKASPSKKDSVVPADEEPVQKGKRVKRSTKKSSTTPTTEAQVKEVKKKSLRDFQKSPRSGSGLVAEKLPSVEKITPPVTSEGTGDKPGVHDVTKDESTKSESESWGNDDDDSNDEEGSEQENYSEEHESTSKQDTDGSESDSKSDQQDDDDDEVKDDNDDDDKDDNENDDNDDDKSKGDEDRGMDNIPPVDTEIVSPLDVHVHHEVPRIHTSTLLAIPVSVIPEASSVYTNIPQSSQTFTSPPLQSTPSPLPTTETTNIPSSILDFTSVFRFNDRIIALEKDVAKLKNDPLHTQMTALVDDYLDTWMGATREEFMNILSASLTYRITEQVRNWLPQILLEEVSNFALPVIKKMIQESLNQVNLAKASSQPQSTYEAATKLTEFELKKILIDKINSSKSYLAALEHQEYYDGLVKSYNLEKDFFSSYDVYSLKVAEMTRIQMKALLLDRTEGTKSQPKSSGKFVHAEEPEFEVRDTDMPQEPTDPNWNEDKTPQKEPTQNWLMTLAASTYTGKSLMKFDELMSTLIDFSYILNGLKIENLTQEILLGPAFRLLKGTRLDYDELEYDFEECYKALLEKLDWENPKGGDYPFDLSKPLPLITRKNCQSVPVEFFINNDLNDYPFDLSKPFPLITRGNRQSVPVEFFINNDLKYLQGGISTMTYTTSTTKTKAAQYDLPGIEDMVPNIWSPVKVSYDKYALWGISHWRDQRKTFYAYVRGIQSRGDVYSTKCILVVTHVSVIKKHGYRYLEEIVVRIADNALYKFKEGDFPRLRINDIEDMLLLVVQNWLSGDDVADFAIALRMFTRSLVIQKRVKDLQLGVESYQKQINVT